MYEKYKILYLAANELMAQLGRDGEINTHQECAADLSNALYDIDNGSPLNEPPKD